MPHKPTTALDRMAKTLHVRSDISLPAQRQLTRIYFNRFHSALSKAAVKRLEETYADICPTAGIEFLGDPKKDDVVSVEVAGTECHYRCTDDDVNVGLVALHVAQAAHLAFRDGQTSVSVNIENRPSALIGAITLTADAKGPSACYPFAVNVKRSTGSTLNAEASDESLSLPDVVVPTETRGYCHPGGVLALRKNEPCVISDRLLIRELREAGFIF